MSKESEVEQRRVKIRIAVENAKAILTPGDRLRVTRCPGTKRWVTFAGWDGNWIVSKSGISDISPASIDRRNSDTVDFTKRIVWVVLDGDGAPVFCAPWGWACHEHINSAINEHSICEARRWFVRAAELLNG